MWFLFALLSAFLYSFRGVFEKVAITRTNTYVLGLAVRLFALPLFFVPFVLNPDLFIPLDELSIEFWTAVLLVSFIGTPLETMFYYQAIKEEELSLALPILSLTPVVTLGLAAVFFDEYPSVIGILGILAILAGVYTLKVDHVHEGYIAPLRHLAKSKGVRFMAIVAISLGLGGIFDKMGLKESNVYMYGLFNYLFVSLSLFLFAVAKARRHLGQLWTHAGSFSILGLIVAGYTLLYLVALEAGNTAYVVAIRNASILMSIVWGVLIFKEKGLRTKVIAGSFIFIGLVCIRVFG